MADYESYLSTQQKISELYATDKRSWNQKALRNIAAAGYFSATEASGNTQKIFGISKRFIKTEYTNFYRKSCKIILQLFIGIKLFLSNRVKRMNIYFNPLDTACKSITGGIYREEELHLNLFLLREEYAEKEVLKNTF